MIIPSPANGVNLGRSYPFDTPSLSGAIMQNPFLRAVIMAEQIPDIYADQFYMVASAYGATLSFGVMPPVMSQPELEHFLENPPPPQMKAVVRMSLEHAKAMALVMRRHLKQYEEHNGEIDLPVSVYASIGLSSTDW